MDSALRPYFTREEIQAAILAGVSEDAFPNHAGSKISVVPDVGNGDGYRCPAFDPAIGRCGIYESRPLDCRLYPVAVMWDREHAGVVAGWDVKCPFIADKLDAPESHAYLAGILNMLESQEVARTFVTNPQLIGAFQEDVLVLRPLERITQGVRASQWGQKAALIPFHALTLADRGWFEQLLLANLTEDHPLASYSFAYHFVWRELFTYEWATFGGHTCLFATNQDGTFLALPPVGPEPSTVIGQVFDVLEQRNGGSGISRIENVPSYLAQRCEALGYQVRAKAGDYIYLQDDLAGLKGDRYKSQRASYNHCVKHSSPVIRFYREADCSDCIDLFEHWRAGINEDEGSTYARQVAEDALSAHRIALRHATQLGLVGLVAEVSGRVQAYSFGYPINPSVFCIMLEILNRNIPGLSAFIFREFCRTLGSHRWINTMDDSGIEGLRLAKLSYRPVGVVESHIVTAGRRPT